MGGRSTDVAADVSGGVLRGWRTGSGPPALVLHGGPGLSDYTAPSAGELADGYTVYRYQQRGLAPSTTDGPFTVDTHVGDAVAFLDATDVARCFLIGHSWGGHLAMHMAGRAGRPPPSAWSSSTRWGSSATEGSPTWHGS